MTIIQSRPRLSQATAARLRLMCSLLGITQSQACEEAVQSWLERTQHDRALPAEALEQLAGAAK